MRPHFLFSAETMRPSRVDEMFVDQFDAFEESGFSTSLISDALLQDGKPLRGIPTGSTVVYRGWMLTSDGYRKLQQAVEQQSAKLLIDHDTYLSTHHLPKWYPAIAELTPETRIFPADADMEKELRQLSWSAFFLKDFVKSLKTSTGSLIHDPSQASEVIQEMREFRGEIEGGICVRRVEEFLPDTERRYFVLQGKPRASDAGDVPDIVATVASRINSPFLSVDVIQRRDGQLRVVEVGDGQVSDIVGWSPDGFVQMWLDWANSNQLG